MSNKILYQPTEGTEIRSDGASNGTVLTANGNGGSTWSTSGGAPGFGIVQPPNGTSPTAGVPADTLTLTSADSSITITGTANTDTVDFKVAVSEYNAGNSGTAITLNWNNGPAQKVTLTGNVTFTLSNPVAGAAYIIRIATGAGSFTAAWPGTVKWAGGTAPVITTAASKVDLINLYWDGTNYYGSFSQNY